MNRREFIAAAASVTLAPTAVRGREGDPQANHQNHAASVCCGPTYATPQQAMQAERETLAFVPAINVGTGRRRPDYLATVDLDPKSTAYGSVVHRPPMPEPGDELHHFGWNACSSCHGDPQRSRRFLVVPGLASGNIYILDAADPKRPKHYKQIHGEEIARRTNLSTPHTVHCLADGHIMISMLGDAAGGAPGGFLLLDEGFEIVGRWEKSTAGMNFNYDFWYQPRRNVMLSSEWAAPNTIKPGFKLEDVQAGKYGHTLHFWDWQDRRIGQSVDLGETGLIPLEIRFHHNPDSAHAFVGAALSSTVWHCHKSAGKWQADKVLAVDPIETKGWPFPVPGLITDLVLSLDDRFLYFSNWLHGDLRQYDVSDPAHPRLTGQVWLGGVLGKEYSVRGKRLYGGPQMLQLSLDGRRLYVTSSLYSSWDNQFYPDIAKHGSYMLQLECDTERGGISLNEDFLVDFGAEPHGPVRAHEIRFPGGDSTSDIWV